MLKTFQIEFVRELLVRELDNNNISLFSFYEELTSDEEVNRYVETFRQLCDQQNKSNQVGFGIVSITDSPSFINLNKHTILPFEWGCSIRTTLGNRDSVYENIYTALEKIKGRKFDVALLNTGKLFVVGVVGNYDMKIHDGDFIGEILNLNHSSVLIAIARYTNLGFTLDSTLVYAEYNGKLYRFEYITTEGVSSWVDTTTETITMDINGDNIADYTYIKRAIPEHTSFEKWKLSVSCDTIKVEQPFNLNAQEFCNITFGGSATICQNSVRLGNDMVRLRIRKNKIIKSDISAYNYTFATNWYDIEPMEIGSGLGMNSITNQIRSNYFISNTHNDSTALTFQYAFVMDTQIALLKQWFDYSRYGFTNMQTTQGFNSDCITPNIIYEIDEIWSNWGSIEKKTFNAKIINDIEIENTEGDIVMLNVDFQLQGDNY